MRKKRNALTPAERNRRNVAAYYRRLKAKGRGRLLIDLPLTLIEQIDIIVRDGGLRCRSVAMERLLAVAIAQQQQPNTEARTTVA